MRRLPHRFLFGLCVFTGAVGLFAPLAVIMTGYISDHEVTRLSALGEAYGVISAFLSAAAIGAIAVSIRYQADQSRLQQLHTWRTMHTELLRMVIDNPALFGPCISNTFSNVSEDQYRRHCFNTLWLDYAFAGYEMGRIPESSLRGEILAEMFESDVARGHWETARKYWQLAENVPGAGRDTVGHFYQIVEEEYMRAISARRNSDSSSIDSSQTSQVVDELSLQQDVVNTERLREMRE